MGRVTAKLVAGKAKKRAAAQHEAGLLDDDDIARLGWVAWGPDETPGDDAVTLQDAKTGSGGGGAAARGEANGTQQGAKPRRKGANAAAAGDAAPQSWRAVAADPTSLLMGATEDGFLSLEVRAFRLPGNAAAAEQSSALTFPRL
jgi:hypothetical protein